MQQNLEDGGAREAELVEVLASYAEPRAVSFRFVAVFALLGLLACASLAWLTARAPRRVPLRFEPEPTASFQRGVQAFRSGDFREALHFMREAQSALRHPVPRVEDYIERLELIRRDEERLERAEQALEANEPARALALTALFAPNSPLFAQAEGLGRNARAQLERSVQGSSAGEVHAARAERPGRPADTARGARKRRAAPERRTPWSRGRPPAVPSDQGAW
jgi:hypothetical protein